MNFEQQIRLLEKRVHSPKADLIEDGTQYIIRLELPARDYNWELRDSQILYIMTNKKKEYDESKVKVIYSETKYGKISRRIKLPKKVFEIPQEEKWENGILILVFKKHIAQVSWNMEEKYDNNISWADEWDEGMMPFD